MQLSIAKLAGAGDQPSKACSLQALAIAKLAGAGARDRETCGGWRGDQPSKACRRSRSIDREPAAAGFANPFRGSHVHACLGINIDGRTPDKPRMRVVPRRPSVPSTYTRARMHAHTPGIHPRAPGFDATRRLCSFQGNPRHLARFALPEYHHDQSILVCQRRTPLAISRGSRWLWGQSLNTSLDSAFNLSECVRSA